MLWLKSSLVGLLFNRGSAPAQRQGLVEQELRRLTSVWSRTESLY